MVDIRPFLQKSKSMKIWKKLLAGFSFCSMPFATFAEEAVVKAVEAKEDIKAIKTKEEKTNADVKKVEQKEETAPTKEQIALYFKVLGYLNTAQSGCKNLDMSVEEQKSYIEGVQLSLEGKEPPAKFGDIMDPMQKFLQTRAAAYEKKRQAKMKVEAAENRKKWEEYAKKLVNENKNVKKTASGLLYEITKQDNPKNEKAKEEDTVEIFYQGKLIDGKVFDESKKNPVKFPLSGVIPGMKEGLQLVGEGDSITLYIPDHLAYGEYELPAIPAGSALIFEVTVVKVTKPVKDAAPKAESKKEAKISKEADKAAEDTLQNTETTKENGAPKKGKKSKNIKGSLE